MGHDIDRVVEINRDRDVDLAVDDLAAMTEGAPTLLQRFLTDSETFLDWFPDAITGGQSAMAIDAIRPLLNGDDDAELGHYIRGMVLAYVKAASAEAE